ncbi:bromodomain-containing protein 4 [Folsomia candida]|nr:bromodomain-containing protein 4 [Folsomia candida]
MPWLNAAGGPPASEQSHPPQPQQPAPVPQVAHQYLQPQQVYGTPPNQPVANYYYVSNPVLPPIQQHQGQVVQPQPSVILSTQQQQQQIHPSEISRDQQGSFAYFGSSPIPPPPAFVSNPAVYSTAYGGMDPASNAPVMTQHQLPTPGYHHIPAPVPQQQLPYTHPQPIPVPPPPAGPAPYHTASDNKLREDQRSNHDTTSGVAAYRQKSEKDLTKKVHVSQTSEELPNSQSKDDYRMELAKQVDEKRRKDEERLKREQDEEERLQRKIREDQERLQRELEEDLRRAQEKEEDEKRKASEKVKISELAKKKLEEEKAEIEKQRQKSYAERQEQLKNAASNSRAALSTSPSRYYHRDNSDPSWSWDSTPVRSIKKANNAAHSEEGSGDATNQSEHNRRNPQQFSHPPSVKTSARSNRSSRAEYDDFEDTQPTSACSSKTYSVSESCHEDHNHDQNCSGIPSGLSKSAEEVGPTSTEMMMCPRCARSFSSSDIAYPKSDVERQKVLNFLDNIKKRLREDQDKVMRMRDGFGWTR